MFSTGALAAGFRPLRRHGFSTLTTPLTIVGAALAAFMLLASDHLWVNLLTLGAINCWFFFLLLDWLDRNGG